MAYGRLIARRKEAYTNARRMDGHLFDARMVLGAGADSRPVDIAFVMPCVLSDNTTLFASIAMPVNVGFGVLAAFGIGAVCCYCVRRFVRRIPRHPADLLDSIHIPLLGSVSSLTTKKDRLIQTRRRVALYPMKACAIVVLLGMITLRIYSGMDYISLRLFEEDGRAEVDNPVIDEANREGPVSGDVFKPS